MGIACYIVAPGSSPIEQYGNTTITVTSNPGDPGPAKITWAQGTVAATPTNVAATPGNQSCSVSFTPGASDPAATSFTATANPGGFTATGAGSPLNITGLTNGTNYSVTVTATNSVGTSPASAPASCTPVAGARTNVTGVSVVLGAPGSGEATVSWTLPGSNTPPATPTGYQVVITGPTASTTVVPHPGTSLALTGLAVGSYTATVTAQYADAPTTGTNPASTPVAFAMNPSSVILQQVDVTRPTGALVLTQVCGSNGPIPAAPVSTGFPNGLPPVGAQNSSTVEAPTAGGTTPTLTEDGTDSDPNRSEYPYPTDAAGVSNASYPTNCGLELGTAQFVTRGPGAGQFFAASGILNQVTIVDTRDDDTGWTVSGTMGQFAANGGSDTFSGSQLGWNPVKTEDTGPFTDSLGNTYDQTVSAGPAVAPNSLAATGLSSGAALATAASGSGLGTAILDARLKLLIPVTADAGDYEGTLTITAA